MDPATEVTASGERATHPFPGLYIRSCGLLLGLTGLAKLWAAVGDVKLLAVVGPILGIQFRYLMLVVGLVELAIAAVCLFTKASRGV